VKICNTKNGYSISETFSHQYEMVHNITFAPDGRVMASRSDRDVKICDMTTDDCLFTFVSRHPESILFSPNSAFVASWCDNFYRVRVWNVHTRSLVKDVRLDFEAFYCHVALSPCGGRLVSQSSPCRESVSQSYLEIILWDLRSGHPVARLDFDCPLLRESRIAFAVDGTSVFTHSGGEILQRWRISSAPLSHDHDDPFSNTNKSTSLPMVFIAMQENLSLSRQYCRYKGDEWILGEDGKRILWLPPD
jgi:WD40 repeat protein